MDLLNMDLIQKGLKTIHKEAPEQEELQRWAVGSELICDTAYYGLAAIGNRKGVWFRGTTLGLIAGVTAVILPKPLGLPIEPSNKSLATRLMTVGLYLTGGLVAAAVIRMANNTQSQNG